MKKILFVVDHSFKLVGGSQESLKVVVDGIKDNFDITIFVPGIKNGTISNTKLIQASKYNSVKEIIRHPLEAIKYCGRLRKCIREEEYDIVHTQEQAGFFLISCMKKIHLLSRKIILVHTERGLYTKYNKFYKMLFFYCMRQLDVMIITTYFNKSQWTLAVKNKKINTRFYLIENTAGKRFETFDENKEQTSSNKFVIGFSGRFCDWKNWPLAVKICEQFIEEKDIHFHMAVGCLDENSLLATKLMFSEMKEKFKERFVGEINNSIEEMDNFYYKIDLFILTSLHNTESFGRVLVEAMSRRTALLTTDAGGATEVVGNIENVCNSVEEFKQRILELKNNRDILEKEKNQYFERVKQHYSVQNNVGKHVKLYEFILS